MSDASILLTGESGTGKDVLAHQIHRWSRRAECPFVTVDCTSHSEHLLESELFGHTRGAFNGAIRDKAGLLEAGHGGSIFLDEIADLTAALQTKLLHFIKEQTFERMGSENAIRVDARIIAASNHDLVRKLRNALPRGSLLSAWRDHFAGARVAQRPADILPLTIRMLAGSTVRNRRPSLCLSSETSSALMHYRWPEISASCAM